ncbi:uncharacterized protein METZ01_LOCUS26521 [marine metagenome]|uniref:Uncharacterized protein n=1 Tax=marine metagenome TaxID=408172 RepID=A0A381Q6G9_9ZZZZ
MFKPDPEFIVAYNPGIELIDANANAIERCCIVQNNKNNVVHRILNFHHVHGRLQILVLR